MPKDRFVIVVSAKHMATRHGPFHDRTRAHKVADQWRAVLAKQFPKEPPSVVVRHLLPATAASRNAMWGAP